MVQGAGSASAKSVFQLFRARGAGNALIVEGEDGAAAVRFDFSRQPEPGGLCLAGSVNPAQDAVATFVVTAGAGLREAAEELKQKGEYS